MGTSIVLKDGFAVVGGVALSFFRPLGTAIGGGAGCLISSKLDKNFMTLGIIIYTVLNS